MLYALANLVRESMMITTSLPRLHIALCPFDQQFGSLAVMLGSFVERRIDDFSADTALHIRDFLGALVHEQHEEHYIGIVGGNAVCDLLRSVVLPAFGGETIMARCPLPIGATRSMHLMAKSLCPN